MRAISIFTICITALLVVCSTKNFFQKPNEHNPVFLNESYHSGFLSNDNGGDIFYILFNSRSEPDRDPLILWLTGGPGCSGEMAVFIENGPFKINPSDLSLSLNPYSWNNKANVLYVDQPAGAGFSSTKKYDKTESDIAHSFYNFFIHFLTTYPQFKNRKFYITGESFAGHFIPVITSFFLDQKNPDINIQGISIGNGWVEPLHQYPSYPLFAYENGLISRTKYEKLSNQVYACQKAFLSNNNFKIKTKCNQLYQEPLGNPKAFNIYDVRLPCHGKLCYDLSFVDRFLAKPEVKKALGTIGRSWSECNGTFHRYFSEDHEVGYSSYITNLLHQNIPVLIYNGMLDYIGNYRGAEAWTNALDYAGHNEFKNSEYKPYGENSFYKSVKGLTFFKIRNAGHLVPMDQPEDAIKMLYAFINGEFSK